MSPTNGASDASEEPAVSVLCGILTGTLQCLNLSRDRPTFVVVLCGREFLLEATLFGAQPAPPGDAAACVESQILASCVHGGLSNRVGRAGRLRFTAAVVGIVDERCCCRKSNPVSSDNRRTR